MVGNRAGKNIVDEISRIKRFGDTLSIDEGLSIEERLENIRLYYSKEQFDELVQNYKNYPEKDAFEYSYIKDVFDDIRVFTSVIEDNPAFVVSTNDMYSIRYYTDSNIIEFSKGYLWFIHSLADVFSIVLPKVAADSLTDKDVEAYISMVCDLSHQLRILKIHELLQTPISTEEYKLGAWFEYTMMLFTCLHEIGHQVLRHAEKNISEKEKEIEADKFAFFHAFNLLTRKFNENRILMMAIIAYYPVFDLVYHDVKSYDYPTYAERKRFLISHFLENTYYFLQGKNHLIGKLYQDEKEGQALNRINNFIEESQPICIQLLMAIEQQE